MPDNSQPEVSERSDFSPIAIVGRSCLLPGASSPEALWQLVSERRSAISQVPQDRWRLNPEGVLCSPEEDSRDRSWSDLGGYVEGFEKVFSARGFAVSPARLDGLDPIFLWTLHTAREALRDAGDLADGAQLRPRTGAIFGNLSFPNGSMNQLAESVWFGDKPRPHAFNRFTSSGPATLLEEALSLGGGSYCLDAACASSLVAIKLACDRLQDGTCDRMLAGAVNRTDDLFIHIGFCALQAMSRRGESRPFHAEADGLLPAEGAGFVVLKRLADARRDGDTIHGVIRGVGLSNDGRGQGLLAPSAAGQERALRLAYQGSGVDPRDVSLLECHATGTPIGDATELRSSAKVFGAGDALPIGSLKSNMGHLVTTAGVAGLIKVLEAMKHGVRPPTLGCDKPLPMIADSPFRVLQEQEPWQCAGPRTAGISAFGFGGNNAHVVVQENDPQLEADVSRREPAAGAVAVVGIGITVGTAAGRSQVSEILDTGGSLVEDGEARIESVPVTLPGLRFPPQDLKQSLAQQVLLLQTAREAVADAGELADPERIGVVMGMEADPEIGRYGARWRMAERGRALGASSDWIRQAQDAAVPGLEAAGVLGTMPNIPANRVNSQLNAGGFGLTVSAGQDSGLVGLEMAARALRRGEIDTAIVGAADLSCEPVHRQALAALAGDRVPPAGDASIVLVLERLEIARERGRHIYATLETDCEAPGDQQPTHLDGMTGEGRDLHLRFGLPFAAAGLLRATLGILALDRGVRPGGQSWQSEDRWLEIGRSQGPRSADFGAPGQLLFHRQGEVAPRVLNTAPDATPTLEFSAHPPAMLLPARDAESSTQREGIDMPEGPNSQGSPSDGVLSQAMPLAPALPSVSSSAAFSPAASGAAVPEPLPKVARVAVAAHQETPPRPAAEVAVHRPEPASAALSASASVGGLSTAQALQPAPRAETASSQTTPRLEAFQRHMVLLGHAQQDFIARQTSAHQAFLSFRQRSAAALGQFSGSSESHLQVPEKSAPVAAVSRSTAETPPDSGAASSRASRRVSRSAGIAEAQATPEIVKPEAIVQAPEATVAAVLPMVKAEREPSVDKTSTSKPVAASKPSPASESATPQAAKQSAASALPGPRQPVGPAYDREQLLVHASGKISEIFGAAFSGQDGFERQVRMPEPPLLLADRVTGLDAEPGSVGLGTIWTETDVEWDSWYLHHGTMPTGIMIESGQADLMLISYVGIDMLNRSERVYRLLGCELTFHNDLPRPGETLKFEIHLDGHAKQGDVRLMFFHYQCRINGEPRLTVRSGQAGFFTDEELADSAGVLWSPEEQEVVASPRLDPPTVTLERNVLERSHLEALAAGRPWECFGRDFAAAKPHVRTPTIASGRMLFLDRVSDINAEGGPWQRGYLRAETPVTPDDWFFGGHFKNDPCMPGTLMMEGCLQTMAIYMLAMGDGLGRDGWRFQPVSEEPFLLRCRGQVLPSSRHLVYEVFVEERLDGPIPTLYADLLCTVDGLKAFHARRVGLQLVPDYPMNGRSELNDPAFEGLEVDHLHVDSLLLAPAGIRPPGASSLPAVRPAAPVAPDGFEFDYRSLLACAWGRPSEAFGSFYERFDGSRQVARLPGPPYHFISRILRLEGDMGAMQVGSVVEVEYDIPQDAWYFSERDSLDADPGASQDRPMPYAVLLEAGLQPCGWLASYVGSTVQGDGDLMFRNLDGTAEVTAELFAGSGPLRTIAKIVDISKTASLIVESFVVESYVGDQLVQKMDTVFGFFPGEAMENQVGLPISDTEKEQLEEPGEVAIDLHDKQGPWFLPGRPRLAQTKLLMLDRITGLWPEGGVHGLGRIRGEKDVDANEWFFKAHFYSDPVQPGSLGIEAMIQLLQVYMLATNMDHGIENPRFEPLQLGKPLTWKYRGQVVPRNQLISSTMDIVDTGRDDQGAWAIAETSLWVDGKRIYHATSLGMRIVSGDDDGERSRDENSGTASDGQRSEQLAAKQLESPGGELQAKTLAEDSSKDGSGDSSGIAVDDKAQAASPTSLVIDPERDTWIRDHCPTYTVPVLPMMSMVDLMAAGAPEVDGKPVVSLRDVRVKGWLTVDRRRTLHTESDGEHVRLIADGDFEVATARVQRGDYAAAPAALPRVEGELAPSPYESGLLFHGPAFQMLKTMVVSDQGASSVLNAKCGVPIGFLNAGLLDGATHCIPHDQLQRWDSRYDEEKVAFPAWIPQLEIYGPTPTEGVVRCEVRPDGFVGTTDFPAFRVQLIGPEGVWLGMRLVEACFPKGPIGRAAALDRKAFLKDRSFVPGLSLSRQLDDGTRRLSEAEVQASDWLPGTMESLYGSRDPERIAILEQASLEHQIHAGRLTQVLPLQRFDAEVQTDQDDVVVSNVTSPLDLSGMRAYWSRWTDKPGPIEDLYFGLIDRFARRVVIENPEDFASLQKRSVLFLANHQVGIESLLFTILSSGLLEVPTMTLAKIEHQASWMGRLIALSRRYPGARLPQEIAFFDRKDAASLANVLGEIGKKLKANEGSLMVHVAGTRSLSCRQPVENMSGAFVDLALQVDVPVVPVRFAGGLPAETSERRLEFPVGMGTQDIYFGTAIRPEVLRALHYGQRRQKVMEAINGLGPANSVEQPNPPDRDFAGGVAIRAVKSGMPSVQATLYQVLAELETSCDATRRLLEAARPSDIEGDDAESAWLRDLASFFFASPA